MWGDLATGIGNYANRYIAFNSKEAASSKPMLIIEYMTNSLEVPYQGQGYANWCVPTSLAMVLRYYGQEFHGWDYASEIKLDTDSGPTLIDYMYLGQDVHEKYPSLTVEYGYYNPINKDQIFTDLQSNLIQGYPVMLAVVGHFVVVVGYNSSGLFVNDPSGNLFTNLLKNSIHVSSYNEAYVPWDTIQPYIVTFPFSTITIKGVSNSESKYGTMYLNLNKGSSDVVFSSI